MKKLVIFLLATVLLFSVSSCTKSTIFGDMTSENVLAVELVDTFGYTLGLLAAKDPVLKMEVESHYNLLAEQGISVALMNEALTYLGDMNPAYNILAYKLLRVVENIGGELSPDGASIIDLGNFDPKLIEVGKKAYLFGIQSGGA